jgi:hypothetical protein
MTHWIIEKDGTGIEKSGTGIEKSGTGIEKSGTGIEKSGTGIEKSGTGIRKGLLALSMASIAFVSQINASQLQPEGTLSLVVQNDAILVSWIIDGSVFSGVTSINGTTSRLSLTEITLANPDPFTEVTGGGTGTEVTGGGTGTEVTGGGTGIEVTGGGTGTEVTGGGTGTENNILVTGGGTGQEDISITLPAGTGLEMEISLGCDTATVSILDANYTEVVSFRNVKVVGDTGLCQSSFDGLGMERGLGNDLRRKFNKR